MRSFVALTVILLTTCVSASPFNLPLTKTQGNGAYLKAVREARRARSVLKSRDTTGSTTIPATNAEYSIYTTEVGIGSPPTYYNLIADTGSSNIFCGAGTPYVRTSTSIPTGQFVNVSYGSGNFTGMEYLDQVTLAPNLVIKNQSIGDALNFSGFQGFDGIIGLGPPDLTRGTLPSERNTTIPTVMNNLISQGVIESQVLGVYFSPSTNYTETNGALTFGGVDSSLYEGELTYVPLTGTHPASYYWGINVTLCTYGSQSIIPASAAGIVDTGTTQVLFGDDLFDIYMKAIPGATFSNSTSIIEIPPSSIKYMQPLTFFIGGNAFILDVAAQLVPTYENEGWGGVAGVQYGVVGKTGSNSGHGLDFILGQTFMERYYTVFDADQGRIGFALTNNTFSTYQR